MEKSIAVQPKEDGQLDGKTLLALITTGDMAGLDPERKVEYYKARCEAAGLDPRTVPFQFIRLQGKEVLYATKSATDQLTKLHHISVNVLDQKTENDIRIVMVRAMSGDKRQTDEMGAVAVGGLKGADLANACMKAITKAKRRAVLSLCGLGMVDELEIETVPEQIEMPEPTEEPMPEAQAGEAIKAPVLEPTPTPAVNVKAEVKTEAVIIPVRIVPEKKAEGGFLYNVYDTGGHLWVSHVKNDALALKTAMEGKKEVVIQTEGNVITGVEVPM